MKKIKTIISSLFLFPLLLKAEVFQSSIDEIVVKDFAEKEGVSEFSQKSVDKGKNIYIPDILKNEPDVDIRRRTLVSDNADMLSIRGLSSNRILLNLNSRPLNAAGVVGGYYIDWSTLPMDSIEKIQIIKGGGDVKYGNNALGGVVNIITKKPTEKMNVNLFSSYGVNKDIDYIQNYRFSTSYKIKWFGYNINSSYSKADEFLWNNNYEAKNGSGYFYFDMPYNGEMMIGVQYTYATRGFIRNNRKSTNIDSPLFYQKYNNDYPLAFGEIIAPGFGNQNIFQPGPGSYWNKEKTYLDFSYKQPIKDYFTELKLYKNIENRFEKNYSSHLTSNTYTDGLLVLNRKVESDRSWGGSFSVSREFEKNNLEFGTEYKYLGFGDIKVFYYDLKYNNNNTYTGGPASQEGKIWAYYIKDSYKINDKVNINTGLRYDDYKVNPLNGSNVKTLNDDSLSPSFSVDYKFNEKTNINLSGYIKSRTPGMPEVYWWSEGLTGGTNDLKSEKNKAVELNIKHSLNEKSYINLSAYNYDIDDYIMFRFDANGQNQRAVYNISNVNIKGASLDFRTKINVVSFYSNFSLQKSKKGYDMYDSSKLLDELDYMPKFKSNFGATIELPYKSSLSFNWRYTDTQKTLYSWYQYPSYKYKVVNLKSYNIWDMELKVGYINNTEFSLFCDNIFNENYQERFGYHMPKRTVGLTAKVYF